MPAGWPQVAFRPKPPATMGSVQPVVCILLTFTPPPNEREGSALPPQLWLSPQQRPHRPLLIYPLSHSFTHSIHSLSQFLVQQILPEHLLHVRHRGYRDKYHSGAIFKNSRVRSSPSLLPSLLPYCGLRPSLHFNEKIENILSILTTLLLMQQLLDS